MNIKITHSWLLEYIDTDATPEEIQKYLSLCGPSVERIEKYEDEIVYDIEITSNRIDMASVLGIAQEAVAILPMFGKKAVFKKHPLTKNTFSTIQTKSDLELQVLIEKPELCPRFTAIVLDNIHTTDSPAYIQKRLSAIGIKVINNVIDISNYLMVELGQPSHVFNYDAIGQHTMKMRESRNGEKLMTLDEKEIVLPGGDIIIEDGDGKLIDLCGIMGGYSSRFVPDAKRIVFFTQNYDKVRIRRTTMKTGQRTVAASYFEKGIDSERAQTALVAGVELLIQYAKAIPASVVYDIYPAPYTSRALSFSLQEMNSKIGVTIPRQKIMDILTALDFKPREEGENVLVQIPSYRANDMSIVEDIVEEVARIYGYFAIPSVLQPMKYVSQPLETEQLFSYQKTIKTYLKHLGMNEVMNYSACSPNLLKAFALDENRHLHITNSISEDIKFLRMSLIPSLVQNIKQNEGFYNEIRIFEIAKTYIPTDKLPEEKFKIGIAVNTSYEDLKGIIDGLCSELNIETIQFEKGNNQFFVEGAQGTVLKGKTNIGAYGQIRPEFVQGMNLKSATFAAEIDFSLLISEARLMPMYKAFSQYATITLDLTTAHTKPFAEMKRLALQSAKHLVSVSAKDTYKDTLTLRFVFTDPSRNLTEKEALAELEEIKKIYEDTVGDFSEKLQ